MGEEDEPEEPELTDMSPIAPRRLEEASDEPGGRERPSSLGLKYAVRLPIAAG